MSRVSLIRSFGPGLAILVFLSWTLAATPTTTLRPGTVLPVTLRTTLRTSKNHRHDLIRATVMQDIPGTNIRKGAQVLGEVVNVTPMIAGHQASLTLRFYKLETKTDHLSINTSLRAFASFMGVHEAQLPLFGPDRGTPEPWWRTRQIGGQAVYGWGGPVRDAPGAVATPDGIVAKLQPDLNGICRDLETNDHPQALWLFSVNACGLYGFGEVDLQHAGRTEPFGQITLVGAPGKNVTLYGGSGMLLQILGPEVPPKTNATAQGTGSILFR